MPGQIIMYCDTVEKTEDGPISDGFSGFVIIGGLEVGREE